jgi:hypothetical protein
LFEFFLAADGTEELQDVGQLKLMPTDRSVGTDAIVVTVATEKGLFVLAQQLKATAGSILEKITPDIARSLFDAFRDQHGKKTAPVDLRRAQFEREIAKLSPRHEVVLRYVVSCGDRDAQLVTQYLNQQGTKVALHEAERLLTEITEMTGLLEIKSRRVHALCDQPGLGEAPHAVGGWRMRVGQGCRGPC